ncbi:MAG: carotenoid oxygenase family protein [Kofleriaceae bacterium]
MVAAKPLPVSTPTATSASDAIWTKDLGREHGFEPLVVEGTLPPSLRGTLYRNGPGQFGQFGTRYKHPFEGDGHTTAVRIEGGKATGASKLHATAGLVEERAAGKILYNFSASWPRRLSNMWRGRVKNTANTNVMTWQGRVFAMVESSRPTEIDPRDLSTIGETDLGVVARAFSAHPHRVESRKAIYNFGVEYGRFTKLFLYELPDTGAARKLGEVTLGAAPMLHDFIATDTHLVFFVSPTRIDVPRMMLQIGGFAEMFQWKPELGTEVICVPIDRPTEVVRFTTEAFYQWHFANAFTRGHELVVDYIRYPNFDSFYSIGALANGGKSDGLDRGQFHRATIDLAAKTLRSEPTAERDCEFPTIASGFEGREHAITYVAFDNLGAIGSIDAKGTIRSHAFPTGVKGTEPVWADGYLLSLCHLPDRAYVAVFDANRISEGPVAKIWIDHHVPITFHGTFARS